MLGDFVVAASEPEAAWRAFVDPAVNLASGFGGAIVGAIVAGLIASKASGRQQIRDDMSSTFGVVVKMLQIVNGLWILYQVAMSAHSSKPASMAAWTRLEPSGNHFPDVIFDAKEVGVFLANDASLATSVLEMGAIYADLVHVHSRFAAERDAFGGEFGASIGPDGIGITSLTAEEMARAGPRLANMQSLATAFLERTPGDFRQALKLIQAIFAASQKRFGGAFPKMDVGELERRMKTAGVASA